MVKYSSIVKPAYYSIRVQGIVGTHWSAQLGGLRIVNLHQRDPPETILSGQIIDQSALLGILIALYDMGFILLEIECRQPNYQSTT